MLVSWEELDRLRNLRFRWDLFDVFFFLFLPFLFVCLFFFYPVFFAARVARRLWHRVKFKVSMSPETLAISKWFLYVYVFQFELNQLQLTTRCGSTLRYMCYSWIHFSDGRPRSSTCSRKSRNWEIRASPPSHRRTPAHCPVHSEANFPWLWAFCIDRQIM